MFCKKKAVLDSSSGLPRKSQVYRYRKGLLHNEKPAFSSLSIRETPKTENAYSSNNQKINYITVKNVLIFGSLMITTA